MCDTERMSSPTPLQASAESLRPLLHEEIDRLADSDLEIAHRLLRELEARTLFDALRDAAERDRLSGRLEVELVDKAIQEHRQRKPYR